MNSLLDALAHMSALRERDALEEALATAVRQAVVPSSHGVRWVQRVGTDNDRHWQIRAEFREMLDTTERDHTWADWSQLPRQEDCPTRLQALLSRTVLVQGQPPSCTTLFPLAMDDVTDCLLEVDSSHPLTADTYQTIQTLLRIYCNLVGLLNYGEKDALTGLLNRKSFDSAFVRAAMQPAAAAPMGEHSERRTPATGGPYWMALLDIDHFKRINDNFGHLIGDEVLVLLARIMRSSLRVQDQLYRFGGEEFVVMLRCPDHGIALEILERFRHTVETFRFPQVTQVTVSIGFTALNRDDTPDLAFNRADQAVYHAKENGRNRVCSFSNLLTSGSIQATPAPQDDIEFF